MPKTMTKSEVKNYLEGYMDACNDLAFRIELLFDDDSDLDPEPIDDGYLSQEKADSSQGLDKEEPEVETSANSSKTKPRTGTNVPEPRNVPHAPEKPTKSPMPKVNPTHDKFVELFKEGKLPTEVAKELGVSPATAYNHLNKARQEGELK